MSALGLLCARYQSLCSMSKHVLIGPHLLACRSPLLTSLSPCTPPFPSLSPAHLHAMPPCTALLHACSYADGRCRGSSTCRAGKQGSDTLAALQLEGWDERGWGLGRQQHQDWARQPEQPEQQDWEQQQRRMREVCVYARVFAHVLVRMGVHVCMSVSAGALRLQIQRLRAAAALSLEAAASLSPEALVQQQQQQHCRGKACWFVGMKGMATAWHRFERLWACS